MIKAIIFDMGGVYFTNGSKIAYEKLVKEFPIEPDKISEILWGKVAKEYRYGKIKKKDFWKEAIKIAGKKFNTRKFSYIWNSSYEINEGIQDLIVKLKNRYKLAVLSGNIRERVRFLNNKYNFKKNFDVIVCSYMVGTSKPDKRMYLEIIRRLKVKPEECIIIDDLQESIFAAESVGFKTILFKDIEQLKSDLKKSGILMN